MRLLAGNRDTVLEVPDRCDTGARLIAGQVVTLTVRDAEMLRAATLAYLPLLAGLLAGAVLGHGFGGPGDLAVALGGAMGAAAGWVIARSRARHRQPAVTVRPWVGDEPA